MENRSATSMVHTLERPLVYSSTGSTADGAVNHQRHTIDTPPSQRTTPFTSTIWFHISAASLIIGSSSLMRLSWSSAHSFIRSSDMVLNLIDGR